MARFRLRWLDFASNLSDLTLHSANHVNDQTFYFSEALMQTPDFFECAYLEKLVMTITEALLRDPVLPMHLIKQRVTQSVLNGSPWA